MESKLWTDGTAFIPVDYRIFDKEHDQLTKNDHFRNMLKTAKERGFEPAGVVFDSWYGSLENLKLINIMGWNWLTQLKKNRHVSVNKTSRSNSNAL